jgi:hypothetical protein
MTRQRDIAGRKERGRSSPIYPAETPVRGRSEFGFAKSLEIQAGPGRSGLFRHCSRIFSVNRFRRYALSSSFLFYIFIILRNTPDRSDRA